MKFLIRTYGCQMNERDSEALAGKLISLGHAATTQEEEADVMIFNTCSVREQAERKAIGKMQFMRDVKRRHPHLLLGVIGCMAQNRGEELFKILPHLDFVVGTAQLHRLPEIIESLREERRQIARLESGSEVLTEMGVHCPSEKGRRLSDYIAITRGCNRFCSYCIVPYVRGREISRELEDIVDEAKTLVASGTCEIMLLGQNVAAYNWGGLTTPPPEDQSPFADLLYALQEVDGLKRIRFTSPYPTYFTDYLIRAMQRCSKVCHQAHLPLQSGSARILKAMNRQYTPERYLEIVQKLRSAMPDMAFSTDIIVGFPGETDEDFEATRQVMEQVAYDNAYIFKYSPRQGTKSAQLVDDVPAEVKEERNQILLKELSHSSLLNNRKLIGSRQEILVEGPSRRNPARWMGRTGSGKSVMFHPAPDEEIGALKMVDIVHATEMSLFAAGIPDLDL